MDVTEREQVLEKHSSHVWIAAWAVEHGAPLATRNVKHFDDIPSLTLVPY